MIDEVEPNNIYAGLQNGHTYHSGDDEESWTNLEVSVPAISDMKSAHA